MSLLRLWSVLMCALNSKSQKLILWKHCLTFKHLYRPPGVTWDWLEATLTYLSSWELLFFLLLNSSVSSMCLSHLREPFISWNLPLKDVVALVTHHWHPNVEVPKAAVPHCSSHPESAALPSLWTQAAMPGGGNSRQTYLRNKPEFWASCTDILFLTELIVICTGLVCTAVCDTLAQWDTVFKHLPFRVEMLLWENQTL